MKQWIGRRVLPKALESLYTAYSFKSADSAPAFAYDTIREWERMTERLQDGLYHAIGKIRTLDRRLAAQEEEFCDKLAVCWRLRGLGTLFVPDTDALSAYNTVQADALHQELAKRGRYYAAAILAMPAEQLAQLYYGASLRLDKGKGAPFWFPSTEKEVTFAIQRLYQDGGDLDEYVSDCANAGQAKLPTYLQSSYIRIQSNRNPLDRVVLQDGHLAVAGERFGPKIRRIAAQPFVLNHLWAPAGNVLRTIMAGSPDNRTTGTIEPAIAAARSHKYTAAIDLKAYDTTVSYELLMTLHDVLLRPSLDALVQRGVMQSRDRDILLDADRRTQEMAILLPPRQMAESAYIVAARGQTRSGENLTSWKGTEINRARCNLKLRDVERSTGKAVHAINYGDDTVIFANDALAIDAWLREPEAYGFKEEAAADTTFLMRRLPGGYSYLGRMLMGSINREPAHEPETVLDAAAAFTLRQGLLTGHPMAAEYIPLLVMMGGPERMTEAVALAQRSPDPVSLTLVASMVKEGKRVGKLTDDRLDALRALASQPAVSPGVKALAAQAILALHSKLDLTHRAIPWKQFRDESRRMTAMQARAMIKSKSYVIGMQRAGYREVRQALITR